MFINLTTMASITITTTEINGQPINGINATLTWLVGGVPSIEYSLVNEDEHGNSEQLPDSTKRIELTEAETAVLDAARQMIETKILTAENLSK